MKKTYLLILLLIATAAYVRADIALDIANQDTARVNQLNKEGFKARFSDHDATIKKGQQALELAQKLNYIDGIAEAYRTIGVGETYANNEAKSISAFLNALSYFQKAHNMLGQAKIYNNMGILYLTVDYDQARDYFEKGLAIAQSINNTDLIAKIELNMGSVYLRKQNFSLALQYYDKSQELLKQLNDQQNLVICLLNQGAIYMNLRELDKAKEILLKAHDQAKALDMNSSIGSIDLNLSTIFMDKKEYDQAQKFQDEGVNFAQITNDEKLAANFTYNSYQLEMHRRDYGKAVSILHKIYERDSTAQASTMASDLNLMQEQHDQQEKQKENELIIERQKNDRVKFWWAVSASGLLLIVIALLVGNVKRKAKTNLRLTELNAEVSRQKDNLDRINHHLEEIIDERTRDLQIKNKKLSEYSSYLSHQIRGPIATLKGLMNLEKEGLVDQQECINMMNKCVSDIDEKIIDMTDILHDPKRSSF
ncbi:MAG TPA: tetratricopeptide repeat protein [Mucilaginibacter sp.]|jgi:tetratricopeptide (TPR) repeat protein|nr:tetratricopeptide repeat protein [Mucilaginibacter sp.]